MSRSKTGRGGERWAQEVSVQFGSDELDAFFGGFVPIEPPSPSCSATAAPAAIAWQAPLPVEEPRETPWFVSWVDELAAGG